MKKNFWVIKKCHFLKVFSFTQSEQTSDYCLNLNQDSQYESIESVKFIEKFPSKIQLQTPLPELLLDNLFP